MLSFHVSVVLRRNAGVDVDHISGTYMTKNKNNRPMKGNEDRRKHEFSCKTASSKSLLLTVPGPDLNLDGNWSASLIYSGNGLGTKPTCKTAKT